MKLHNPPSSQNRRKYTNVANTAFAIYNLALYPEQREIDGQITRAACAVIYGYLCDIYVYRSHVDTIL